MSTAAILAEKPDYRPSEDEEFMNERQLEYFKQKLLNWKEDILRESRETLTHLQTETENHPDIADRATSETDQGSRTAYPGPSAQADLQDRRCASADRRRVLRLLRGHRRAYRRRPPRSPPDRHPEP